MSQFSEDKIKDAENELITALDEGMALSAKRIVEVNLDLKKASEAVSRDATIEVLSRLLRRGLIELGDMVPCDQARSNVHDFTPWNLSSEDSIKELTRRWMQYTTPKGPSNEWIDPGDVCWYRITEAGYNRADQLRQEGWTPKDEV